MISGPSSPSSVLFKFLRDHGDAGVFDPHAVRTLVATFDGAWQSIKASGAKLSDKQIEFVRENLAKYIIEQARHGELDECRTASASLGPIKSETSTEGPEIAISSPTVPVARLCYRVRPPGFWNRVPGGARRAPLISNTKRTLCPSPGPLVRPSAGRGA